MTEELKKEIKEVVKETITDLIPELKDEFFEQSLKRQQGLIMEIYDNSRQFFRKATLNIETINVGTLNTNCIKDGKKLLRDSQITN